MDERIETLNRFRGELTQQVIPLHKDPWQFQPDPQQVGAEQHWFKPDWDDSQWKTILVDRHWEGQGFQSLDKWAWYRTRWTVPANWHSPTTYLNFTGIDDYADIYVNGEKIGSVGDIEKKETAFETRVSFDITRFVAQSKEVQITVSVYDWFGAGGIFRPVSISMEPLDTRRPILKK